MGIDGCNDRPFLLSCGALAASGDVFSCPDPYCRVCRDETGEVRDFDNVRDQGVTP